MRPPRGWNSRAWLIVALFAGCSEAPSVVEEGVDAGADVSFSPGDAADSDSDVAVPDAPDTVPTEPDVAPDVVEPLPNDAEFVSQVVPAAVDAGASFEASVTFRNVGTNTWSFEDKHFLGSENPRDNQVWGTNRMVMDPDAVVAPGEEYTFSAVLTAPSAAGDYDMQWQLLQDAVEWFGEPSDNVVVTVSIPEWAPYPTNPFAFDLAQPVEAENPRGSIFAHRLNSDPRYDFVVTGPGVVGAYAHDGALLWTVASNIHLPGSANGGQGYPGIHAPGAIAGDVDGDDSAEVAWLTFDGALTIVSGTTGDVEAEYAFSGAEALAIANLRGVGDRDAVLQYSQQELRAVNLETGETLWHQPGWFGIEHTQVRVTDVDGDGLDEVVGPVFLDDDGSKLSTWGLKASLGTALGGLDSLAIGDIEPGGPLEIAMAEQGGNNQTLVVNHTAILWGKARPPGDIPPSGQCKNEKDPDKVAVGDFDPDRPGLEVFARSACGNHPWVHDAQGEIVAAWNVADVAPAGWKYWQGDGEFGIEEIVALDWTGTGRHHLLLKERHDEGQAAVVDAMTGAFGPVFADADAARTYAADLAGDHREEVVIVTAGNPGRVTIHQNTDPAPPPQPRRWETWHYRRTRQNWNYYSP